MDKINEFLKKNWNCVTINGIEFPENTKRVHCKDGYSISVQASSSHYCNPRENKAWPYSEVELGYPDVEDELINEFAEDYSNLTETVYGYVPIKIVNQLIEKHGGIIETEEEA